jgi:O-antigen ligase
MQSHDDAIVPAHPWLDRVMFGGLLAFVAALQFSIAGAEILLAITLVAWVVSLALERERPEAPAWFWPLTVYAALTLLATAFSLDPRRSLGACKQMFLFLLVPATWRIARGRRAELVIQVILTVGAVSALVGVVQYGILHYDTLHLRPRGTLGHWMTYSGLLMLVTCTAAARLLFERKDRVWPSLIMPVLVVALAITFTRSAWVGTCVGVGLLLILKDFRLLALLPVVAALFIGIAPSRLIERAYSMFDLRDPTNRDRLSMLQAGAEIVRRYPLTGVGPNVVQEVYPNYRRADAVEPNQPHLHNVPLQIAAERGLPAAVVWIWFLWVAARGLLGKFRAERPRYLAAAGLGAIAAMLAAGFFEYNFGDSEFLMLLLVLLTLPWAATSGARTRAAKPQAA